MILSDKLMAYLEYNYQNIHLAEFRKNGNITFTLICIVMVLDFIKFLGKLVAYLFQICKKK